MTHEERAGLALACIAAKADLPLSLRRAFVDDNRPYVAEQFREVERETEEGTCQSRSRQSASLVTPGSSNSEAGTVAQTTSEAQARRESELVETLTYRVKDIRMLQEQLRAIVSAGDALREIVSCEARFAKTRGRFSDASDLYADCAAWDEATKGVERDFGEEV